LVLEEKIGYPILLGDEKIIRKIAADNSVDLEGMPIINPKEDDTEEMRKSFGEIFFEKRHRKGVNRYEANKAMKERNHFGCMMVETGVADCMISGLSRNYPDTIKPALQIIGTEPGVKKIAGMYLLFTKRGPLFLADTTNFGSSDSPEAKLVQRAHEIVKQKEPNLICDGEMQGILAFNKEILKENYPFSELVNGEVNTLIFPNLAAGNIAYNLLQEVGGADSVGPILLGLNKPVHVLQLGSSIRSIFNMVVIAVVDAQSKSKNRTTTMPATQDELKRSKWWKTKTKTSA